MILASGARGREFDSRNTPVFRYFLKLLKAPLFFFEALLKAQLVMRWHAEWPKAQIETPSHTLPILLCRQRDTAQPRLISAVGWATICLSLRKVQNPVAHNVWNPVE